MRASAQTAYCPLLRIVSRSKVARLSGDSIGNTRPPPHYCDDTKVIGQRVIFRACVSSNFVVRIELRRM